MMEYYTTRNNETQQEKMVVIFSDGRVRPVERTHPKYDQIKELIDSREADDDQVMALVEALEREMNERFISLSDRIAVANGHLLVDGDVVDNALSQHVLHMMENGDDNYTRVVKFYENVLQNPSPNMVDDLFPFLERNEMFALDENGYVMGYKGVTLKGTSVHSGHAYVAGQLVRGQIPYPLGVVVTMPRADVDPNSATACAPGLHIGTWDYAVGWGDKVAKVVWNPRDAVAVPTEDARKLRVCRLVAIEYIDAPERVTSFDSRGALDESADERDPYYDDEDYVE